MAPQRKTKIAVLGGGPSALSTVFWLTSDPELRANYDITVYQMGWRLGGKGASGRRCEEADDPVGKCGDGHGRIEEHGLHVLFGFYQNFFHMIRSVYAELKRPDGHPLRTWRQAFHPRDCGVEEEFVEGAWDPWVIAFPGNGAVPGSGGALLTLGSYLSMAVQGLISLLFGWHSGYRFTRSLYPRDTRWEDAPDPPLGGDDPPGARLLFNLALAVLRGLTHATRWTRTHAPWIVAILMWMRRVIWPSIKRVASHSRRAHRLWLDVDAILAMTVGILDDGLLLEGGLDSIDDLDYREWLLKHGAHRETMTTTLVRTIYDAAFSYEDGDPDRQRVSAGATVRVLLRWAATYHGAAYYRMQAGMGDVVFAPLYLVLKSRGVKFEFFHKVESLHLSEDGRSIARIRVNRQAELADGVEEYDPLVTIRGLECWPSNPRYAQVKDADRIRGIDLESYYTGYVGEEVELLEGRDFDQVVFGIPIGAVRFVCDELVRNPATPEWQAMVDHVKSVQTCSAQLWFKHDLQAMGWEGPEPLLSLFVEPYNTWADMSQVLDREDWPAAIAPHDVAYFTGAQCGPTDPPPPDAGEEFEREMKAKAMRSLAEFCKCRSRDPKGDPGIGGLTTLLPNTCDQHDPPTFDFSLLVDPSDRTGIDRLDAQYWRSNCGPSERCTISLPGTNRYRMRAGETGYHNLFVTGDWIDNDLYIAFMEASFQSGIHTARAVAGRAFPIIGEWLNHL